MDLSSKIILLDEFANHISLDQYQEQRGLKGAQIGKYFSYRESRFMQDIEEYDQLVVCAPLMIVLDQYREFKGRYVKVNSYNRTEEKQQSLRERGFRAAKFSPHVVKMAADVDTYTRKETIEDANLILEASEMHQIPVRLGFAKYLEIGQTFIHVDVCPFYYGPGGALHQSGDYPAVWEYKQLTW